VRPSHGHPRGHRPIVRPFICPFVRKRPRDNPAIGPPLRPAIGPPPETRPPSGTCLPPTGACLPSIGYPSTLRWVPIRVSVYPARPMGITGHPARPMCITGHPGRSVGPLQHRIFSSTSLLTAVIIHFLESSSAFHKIHPLSRKLINC
jgi:hypothetical protein